MNRTGDIMATYAILGSYTEQGIRDVRQSPKRVTAAKRLAKSLNGSLKQFYLAIGAHDILVIAEFPNDQAVAKFALTIGSLGNVRTSTLKLFPEAEFRKIVGSLPPA